MKQVTVHELKTVPPFFQQVLTGEKSFEVRKDDRGFTVGDVLFLREYMCGEYTGRELRAKVVYRLDGFGIKKGYCVMGIKLI